MLCDSTKRLVSAHTLLGGRLTVTDAHSTAAEDFEKLTEYSSDDHLLKLADACDQPGTISDDVIKNIVQLQVHLWQCIRP